VSFGLSFLRRDDDQDGEDALEAMQENAAAGRPLDQSDLELWRRLAPKGRAVLRAGDVGWSAGRGGDGHDRTSCRCWMRWGT